MTSSSSALLDSPHRLTRGIQLLAVASLLAAMTTTASCRLFNRAYACDDDSNCSDDQICVDSRCEVGEPSPENEPSARDGGEPDAEPSVEPAAEPDDGGEPSVEPGAEPDGGEPGVGPGAELDDGGEPGVGPGAEPDDGGEPGVGPGAEPEDGGASPAVPVDAGNEPEPEPGVDAGVCGGADLNTDPDNCGACGRTCGASIGCTAGICDAETVASFPSSLGKIVARNNSLFYADFGTADQVTRLDNLDTGGFNQSSVRILTARGLEDMHLTGNQVTMSTIQTTGSPTFIEMAPLQGTVDHVVNIDSGNITSSANYAYAVKGTTVVGMTQSRIKRYDRDTGNEISDNALPQSFPRNFVFDNDNVYWVTSNGREVHKADILSTTDTGTSCGALPSGDILGIGQSPMFLFYAINTSPIRIVRMNKATCAQSLLVDDIPVTSFGALFGTDQEVFYTVKVANTLSVMRFAIPTATATTVFEKTVPGALTVISMALDGPYIYLLEKDPNGNDITRIRLPPPPD